MYEWIKEKKNTMKIGNSEIIEKIREISLNPSFKASHGWLKRFMRKMNVMEKMKAKM